MKVFTSTLTLLIAVCHSDAFSVNPINCQREASPSPCAPLAANKLMGDLATSVGIFSAAVAIGISATSPANAVEIQPAFISAESSSVTVSLGEIADFSMPSYKDATKAAPMTDLKGSAMAKTAFDDSSSDTVAKKVVDPAAEAKAAEEKKAAAAEKKIAQKAARVRQLADAEAAVAAAK